MNAHVPAWLDVFTRFLRLGLTAFGGPVAHLGYFRREFVERARWLDDAQFAEIVALCSVLPGPTSSQVGLAIGLRRAGALGALAAWLAFTTPSALALASFGSALRQADRHVLGATSNAALAGALEGVAGVAAAVVVLAVVQLARRLAVTPLARTIGVVAFVLAVALARIAPALQWLPLVAGAALGAAFGGGAALPATAPALRLSRRAGIVATSVFALLLLGLPIAAVPGTLLALFATFFRAGSLVFGGGHVVLPFLASVVGPHDVPAAEFFAGYGAAQAIPGPLFTFAAFLGAADRAVPSPPLGALVATLGIFAPSFLLVTAAVPLWQALRDVPRAPAILAGLGAAVVGLLAAVMVDPIGTTLAREPHGAVIGIAALALLARTAVPVWLVVTIGAATGALWNALAH